MSSVQGSLSLQERLNKAFGSLGGDPAPWQPAARQVFRAGPDRHDEGSSDEEYEERARREAVPGLAQSLVEEDQPDAEGFRPSTAFCRALDAEEEYNEVDEVATGLLARRRGGEALPPRGTQVLDDNPFEERIRQQAAAAAAAPGPDRPAGMDVEQPAAPAAAGQPPAGAQAGVPSTESPRGEKKKVRFEGIASTYVPPSPRPGYQMRCTELPPAGPEEGAQQQRPGAPQRQQRGAGLSRVPDHVTHPERYTCYVLDEPLVVGGGVGQLAGGQHNRLDAAGAAAAEGAQGDEPEPERWSGPVGVAGAVQFKPRQERAGGGAAAAPGGGQGGGPAAPKGRLGAVQLQAAYEDEAGEGEAGEDAAMEAAAAGPRPAAAARAKQRQYRNTRAADMDAE